jgi:hypothetical protein
VTYVSVYILVCKPYVFRRGAWNSLLGSGSTTLILKYDYIMLEYKFFDFSPAGKVFLLREITAVNM